jgi:hypothetical protein
MVGNMRDNQSVSDAPPAQPPEATAPPETSVPPDAGAPRELTAAARRALAEAEERRRAAARPATAPEVGGRDGPDPVRYGDWEKGGIVSDF